MAAAACDDELSAAYAEERAAATLDSSSEPPHAAIDAPSTVNRSAAVTGRRSRINILVSSNCGCVPPVCHALRAMVIPVSQTLPRAGFSGRR
ncbi:hypothetical protein NSK11_contig00030-0025 [Nocardia seriolae]|uniref:Uncharacterized protein n=1 Tax=Nocardia seriolae TaxID=37332 RepID=A0ABC9YT94_9NOCA|nr:hypothetical protein NSER024013_39540 [Nocardia seriolae]GAP28196.1 hypothetical protein NSK11_contig00030-0025 [Nocardia seriolae]GEM23912.1 hypothetical protein NS2_21510 [Nocardia seriolae NBRC 15557]